MEVDKLEIPITLEKGEIVWLRIYPESKGLLFLIDEAEAFQNGESQYQLQEGSFYEYIVSKGYALETSRIVSQSKANKSSGRINTNIFVGTLIIPLLHEEDQRSCSKVSLEVRSTKADYREDYRFMLEEITEKCTDLILQQSSLIYQTFTYNFEGQSTTLYQRFSFVKSIIDSQEFQEAIHKIITQPVTDWSDTVIDKDIRAIKKINGKSLRQIVKSKNRINLPENHRLRRILASVPTKISVNYKKDTVDTPENRFIKYALNTFLSFVSEIKQRSKEDSRLFKEAVMLVRKLEQNLAHSLFKEISEPSTLTLNSPVLQRKEGYREIFRVWLLFDLAAKLIWHGGDDVYQGGKKNIATLYEYWLFFKLLDIIKELFGIPPVALDKLIEETNDGLGLKLKQGKHIPLSGVYEGATRKLNIKFSYNRLFSGNSEYPRQGSWTRPLRPDYTLSIWPYGLTEKEANLEELVVYIHFDAKYRMASGNSPLDTEIDLSMEKRQQEEGTYKSADILKMHTYRDAIRRTAGAYVLYPGSEQRYFKGFHEVLPGLGAFAIRPSKENDGTLELKNFIKDVLDHFLNRASQREKMSFQTYSIHKKRNIKELQERLPEVYGENRNLLPDETSVLVGFYRSSNHYNWILKTGLYNTRTENDRGSLRLGPKETSAKYLLLHSTGELISNRLFKIMEEGPRIFSKKKLLELDYPSEPTQDFYLVYKVSQQIEEEFRSYKWDIRKLNDYTTGRGSGIPFAISLTELMSALVEK